MSTDTCCICGTSFTDDNPAVNISTLLPQVRRTQKHAWHGAPRSIAPACYDCAHSQESLPIHATGTVALYSVTVDGLTGWERGECITCGMSVLMPPSRRRKFFYCCEPHRAAHYRAQKSQDRQERACAQCGEPMLGRADKRFCSTRCRMAHHRATA